MIEVFHDIPFSPVTINREELDALSLKDAIVILKEKVGYKPEEKVRLTNWNGGFNLFQESFKFWLAEQTKIVISKVEPKVTFSINNDEYHTVDRELLTNCLMAKDLVKFAGRQGWIPTRCQIGSLIVDENAHKLKERDMIFHSEYSNYVIIWIDDNEMLCPRLVSQGIKCKLCRKVLFVDDCKNVRRIEMCGHLFHADCIEEWLIDKMECPLCGTSVVPFA